MARHPQIACLNGWDAHEHFSDTHGQPRVHGIRRALKCSPQTAPRFNSRSTTGQAAGARLRAREIALQPPRRASLGLPDCVVVVNSASRGLPAGLSINPNLVQLLGERLSPSVQIRFPRVQPSPVTPFGTDAEVDSNSPITTLGDQ